METSEAVVIGGEDYKVVDECLEEEDSLNTNNHLNQMENMKENETQNCIETKMSNNDIIKEPQLDIKENIKIVCDITDDSKEKDKKSCILNTETIETKPEVKSEKNKNPIDLIADVNSDQLNEQKNLKDKEVMHHLDEMENIVLNSTCFMDSNGKKKSKTENLSKNINGSIDSNENKKSETENLSENINGSIDSNENNKSETENLSENIVESMDLNETKQPEDIVESMKSNETKQSENIVESIDSNENKQSETKSFSKNIVNEDQKEITKTSTTVIDIPSVKMKTETHWYEKKLTEKVDTMKGRMSKLARVLESSYSVYQTWLEYVEKVYGTPICKLEPPCRWPLDKHHTNRWKFNCSRVTVEASKKGDASLHSKEKLWRVDPAGAWGVSKHTIPEIPPFILHAVKIFEDFLQSVQQANEALLSEQFSSDTCIEIDQKNETKPRWLWLIVRCNSIDEIMLFVTGKNISRSTMDHLKQVYESGPGKDCNVKSIYCESIYNKSNDTVGSNTTFLVGSEVLDDVVGGIKIQLAPKTSFWSNPVGAENIAKTVIGLLAPSLRTTVLEVGCGFGLIGLMVASKCRKIIGVDSKSEIEEAEMTCELNNINNASFIVSSSSEITNVIAGILRNCKASAIINTSTNVGRTIDLMICLRKINSLKRIVMITTLTKQSVRAIIELVRPGNRNMGTPFIPVKAYLVDTFPIGPHFEIVILMKRHPIFNQPCFVGALQETYSSNNADSSRKQPIEPVASTSNNKKVNQKTIIDKKTGFTRSKGKFKGKRAHSADRNEGPIKKFARKFDKNIFKPRRGDSSRRKDKIEEGSELRINPMYEKKLRENNDRIDLREKLSNNRIDPEIVNKVKAQQAILDIAKEKLSGSSAAVDVTTVKQLQDMLNNVLEETNKLQSQIPRSVWDRIAPAETIGHSTDKKDNQFDPLLKGRYIQGIGAKDILITKENKQFIKNDEEKVINPMYKKYEDIVPIESNLPMPMTNDTPILNRSLKLSPERYHGSDFHKHHFEEISRNKNKGFDKTWSESSSIRKQTPSPVRKHISYIRHRSSPLKRFSPKRPLLSPPRRPLSPPRKHISPLRRPMSPFRSRNILIDRPFSPSNRAISGLRRPLSPPRREFPSLMRQISPRRHMSPPKQHASSMRTCVTSPKRKMSQIPISKRHHLSSPERMISPSHREMQRMMLMSQERRQSPMRIETSFRVSNRPMSPLNRQITSPEIYADDWDIPSRGAVEQSTWHPSSRIPNKSWRDERQSSNSNWDQQASSINRHRNSTVNQDKWDIKNSSQDNMRISNGGDIWNTKLPSMMQGSKDAWTTSFDNRWSGSSSLPLNSDNWNIRGKESFSNREESWIDKNKSKWAEPQMINDIWKQKGDKDDWNDLPEDAIDPWSDDNSIGLKERRYKFDLPNTSNWEREHEMIDSWSNQKDNWQNKGQSSGTSFKSLWESNNNQI